MRDNGQPESLAQLRAVIENGDNPSIVCFEKDLQDQTDKYLWLSEFSWAESMAVLRQCVDGYTMRCLRHLFWRLGCCAHSRLYIAVENSAQV